eukprot:COSAG04_NODE_3846_length_2478_cov_1.182430_1_plen_36_part_10
MQSAVRVGSSTAQADRCCTHAVEVALALVAAAEEDV